MWGQLDLSNWRIASGVMNNYFSYITRLSVKLLFEQCLSGGNHY